MAFSFAGTVKINKQKTFKLEIGGPAGGALTPYYSLSVAPNRRSTFYFHQEDILLLCLLLQQEEGRAPQLATTQPMKDFYNSANEKPLHFKFPVSSNVLFVYNSPSEFVLSSIKELSCPLFSGPVHGLP